MILCDIDGTITVKGDFDILNLNPEPKQYVINFLKTIQKELQNPIYFFTKRNVKYKKETEQLIINLFGNSFKFVLCMVTDQLGNIDKLKTYEIKLIMLGYYFNRKYDNITLYIEDDQKTIVEFKKIDFNVIHPDVLKYF